MSPSSAALNGSFVRPFGVVRRLRLDPVEREGELGVHRLLDPQRAVIVEHGDAILGSDEIGGARLVTRATKPTIAALAGPSFHDGSGSGWASASFAEAVAAIRPSEVAPTDLKKLRRLSMDRFPLSWTAHSLAHPLPGAKHRCRRFAALACGVRRRSPARSMSPTSSATSSEPSGPIATPTGRP